MWPPKPPVQVVNGEYFILHDVFTVLVQFSFLLITIVKSTVGCNKVSLGTKGITKLKQTKRSDLSAGGDTLQTESSESEHGSDFASLYFRQCPKIFQLNQTLNNL